MCDAQDILRDGEIPAISREPKCSNAVLVQFNSTSSDVQANMRFCICMVVACLGSFQLDAANQSINSLGIVDVSCKA